jgi:hypothetical protein
MSSPFEALQQIAATVIKKIHGLCSIAMCHFLHLHTYINVKVDTPTPTYQYTQISSDFICALYALSHLEMLY